jgi:GT2 family glycosyltransferase
VAVVIPCLNEEATLERCLSSVRAQDPAPVSVVVVDSGSTDRSPAIARRLADVVVEGRRGTIGAARNRGVEAAGDVDAVAFIDADCEAQPGWLAAGLRALYGADGADLAGARVHAPPDAPWVANRWGALEVRMGRPGSALWSANLLARRRTFAAVGGFSEHLVTGEDVDLCQRVAAAGGLVTVVPEMEVVHHGFPATLPAFAARERWHASTPGWWWSSSGRSRLVIAAVVAWVLGSILLLRSGARRGLLRATLVSWAGLSGAGTVAAGVVSGAGRWAGPDGALIALWALVRLSRLPTGLRPPPRPRAGPTAQRDGAA